MYLSKIPYTAVSRMNESRHSAHQVLLAASGGKGRLLWRLEESRQGGSKPDFYLVQTSCPPRWDQVKELDLAKVEFRKLDLSFETGERYRFRLDAEVSVNRWVETPEGRKRTHLGLYTPFEQVGWLEGKGKRWGFKVKGVEVASSTLKVPGKGYKVARGLFDGILEVKDPEGVKEAVQRGLGKSKYLGFGLFSSKKIS